jgi:hypothetical protein
MKLKAKRPSVAIWLSDDDKRPRPADKFPMAQHEIGPVVELPVRGPFEARCHIWPFPLPPIPSLLTIIGCRSKHQVTIIAKRRKRIVLCSYYNCMMSNTHRSGKGGFCCQFKLGPMSAFGRHSWQPLRPSRVEISRRRCREYGRFSYDLHLPLPTPSRP